MAVQIQLRNDIAANWTSNNPVLAVGELGLESDTGNYKIGDGTTAWSSLAYGGVDGASAYEIAVANGFVGDETAWLASLEGAAGADGVGVPAGGTEGQVLAKIDGTDYNTEWVDVQSGSSELVLVNVFNSSATPIAAGAPVHALVNNGSGSSYIVEPWPTDSSGNNYDTTEFLGVALAEIPGSFGEGQVVIAGTLPVSDQVITWNGYVYLDEALGTLVNAPAGGLMWERPIGRATSGNGQARLTMEPWHLRPRLTDLPDVSINYGSISDGDVLSFNDQNYQFEFRTPSGGGGSSVNDNLLLNGGFDVWQEINEYMTTPNTTKSTTPGSVYFADNWKAVQFGGTGSMVQERVNITSAFGNESYSKYGLQTTVSADAPGFEYTAYIEDATTIQNEDVAISFWVKRSAGGFTVNINDVNYGLNGSQTDNVFGPGDVLQPNVWTKISGAVTFPSQIGKTIGDNSYISVKINFQGLQPSEVVSIAQVKVERGSSVTRFKRMNPTYTDELRACQRYYYRIKQEQISETFTATTKINGDIPSKIGRSWFDHPVQMRATPSVNASNDVFTTWRFTWGYGDAYTLSEMGNSLYLYANPKTTMVSSSGSVNSSITIDENNKMGVTLVGASGTGAVDNNHYVEVSARF